MNSLGLYLKKERETKGVTIDEISNSTRISRRFLEAMEQDNFAILPHKTFAFGFLRAYAKCVGINPDETVKMYKELVLAPIQTDDENKEGDTKKTIKTDTSPQQEERSAQPSTTKVKQAVALIALVILVAFIVYLTNSSPQKENSDQSKNSAITKTISTPTAKTGLPTPKKKSANTAIKAQSTKKPMVENVVPTKTITTPAKKAMLAIESAKSLKLTVLAIEEAWINVIIDDKDTKDIILPKGGKVNWMGNEKFIFTTGNFQGVTILLNGKPVPLPKKKGRVLKNFLITADQISISD